MKLNKLLLRWYKSFHLNYRQQQSERGEATAYRPWNSMSPTFAAGASFPFIEIPIEPDITTIVGANESGKSHLLNAISKVLTGAGVEAADTFERTDLCHYAGIRTRNVEAWPNIGLVFSFDSKAEFERLAAIAWDGAPPDLGQTAPESFALILAPDEEGLPACLFVKPLEQPLRLTQDQLQKLRKLLPSAQFIDSTAQLASEVPLGRLIAAYGRKESANLAFYDRAAVEKAANVIQSLVFTENQPLSAHAIGALETAKKSLKATGRPPSEDSLEMLLFKDILGITGETLRYIYDLPMTNRGYIEGQIGKWNEEIRNQLNLSHFWHQDDQFSLSVNYKDGMVYFEVRDKTDSVYTFRERSSGLRFFLSYYIQAKAMEMTSRNRNSIILMDEPDAALSILGQRNLLAVFESLVSPESSNGTCQLIYSTHSPYLINRNFPRRVRVVKKEDAEEGTQYIERARARRYEPVRTALGLDSAPSLFLGADNVLLEGSTDQYLLVELIRVFATPDNVGEFLDLNTVVTVSADGVGNVENVLEQSRWADEPIPSTVVLLDSDKPALDVITKITSQRRRGPLISKEFAAAIGDVVKTGPRVVTIEDIVPLDLYRRALLAYVERWLPDTYGSKAEWIDGFVAGADFGSGGVGLSTSKLFRELKPELEGSYDKMGVIQEVVRLTAEAYESDPQDPSLATLKANVIAICEFLREGLTRSRASVARRSATQAIKRIVRDFGLINKDNVPITGLQTLFRRILREVAAIGSDGEGLLKVMGRYLSELEKLRAAGQERVTEHVWEEWRKRIEQIRQNPLAIGDGGEAEGVP